MQFHGLSCYCVKILTRRANNKLKTAEFSSVFAAKKRKGQISIRFDRTSSILQDKNCLLAFEGILPLLRRSSDHLRSLNTLNSTKMSRRSANTDKPSLNLLPTELVTTILSNLSAKDLSTFSRINKKFQEVRTKIKRIQNINETNL